MMLEVRDLSVTYGRHRALADIGIDIRQGEIVVILGANGAGKSSLLQAVAGMSEGTVAGTVTLDGAPLLGLGADEIVERGIAYVSEGRGIFGDLSVAENLTLGAYSARARARESENMRAVLKLFPKLAERRKQIARTMSGGEQQMVAIGRAIMSDPDILMLDEPSLGLSPLLCKELFHNLSEIRSTGLGVLLVEQNAKQSLAIADRGYLLENGSIIGENDAESMLKDPAVQAAYLGGAAGHTKSKSTSSSGKAASKPSFVRPQPVADPGRSADDLAGEAISGLVRRAAEQATPPPAPAIVPQKQTVRSEPVEIDRSNERDPDVARLLRKIEEAAERARSGNSPPVASRPAPKTEPEGPLPEIKVWRRNPVEVWKRGPDGKLRKVN